MSKLINKEYVFNLLEGNMNPSHGQIKQVLEKCIKGSNINLTETSLLLNSNNFDEEIIETAKVVNKSVHKGEMTFYGVCYISDFCVNTCLYCGDNIYSNRDEWKSILSKENNIKDLGSYLKKSKRLISLEDFREDIHALFAKLPDGYSLKELCMLSGDTPGLTLDKLIKYLKILSEIYQNKVILNIPPLTTSEFKKIRSILPKNKLQFRVFQETYDPDIYSREHPLYDLNDPRIKRLHDFLKNYNSLIPSKRDIEFRVNSQSRALDAGFDEVGLAVLFGLNDGKFGSKYEVLGMKLHADYLEKKYKKNPASVSFPRILPSKGVNYGVPNSVGDDEFMKLIAITRMAIPKAKLIITCREKATFRSRIRPLINIEDYEARPGPFGNAHSAIFQMEIIDRRKGIDIFYEMKKQGFKII